MNISNTLVTINQNCNFFVPQNNGYMVDKSMFSILLMELKFHLHVLISHTKAKKNTLSHLQ